MDKVRYLLHVYEVLDVEYDMIEMMIRELRSQGDSSAADDLAEAKQNLYKAILNVKDSWKFMNGSRKCEQIKMNI